MSDAGVSQDTECPCLWSPQWVILETKLPLEEEEDPWGDVLALRCSTRWSSWKTSALMELSGCAVLWKLCTHSCLHWCCCQCPAQLGSSQERGSELADQQTRCAVSAGAGMPMLQWLLSTSNRWWQDPSFFGDKLAKWFMEPHLMMAVFWAWLYECTICLLWTSVARIQCLADGKLITYRVALASLSVLEFISKPWEFEQPDLSPTQYTFVTCKWDYLVVGVAHHSTAALQRHCGLLASHKASQTTWTLHQLVKDLNTMGDSSIYISGFRLPCIATYTLVTL